MDRPGQSAAYDYELRPGRHRDAQCRRKLGVPGSIKPTGQFYHVIHRQSVSLLGVRSAARQRLRSYPQPREIPFAKFHDWRPIEAGDENGYIAPDPVNPGIISAALSRGKT